MKIDRQLIVVEFVTWMPADQRMAAQGQLAPDSKVKDSIVLWSPFPVDERGIGCPDKMPPEDQGVMWAQKEAIRLQKAKGREILAILGISLTGIVESHIANQPKEQMDNLKDFGLKPGNLITP